MRSKIISACVRHVREFGYPHCNAGNVLTDLVYRQMAKWMLNGTLEEAGPESTIGRECAKLIQEIDQAGETKP